MNIIMSKVKGQLNFNSLLISMLGGLFIFGLHKLDDNNTHVIELGTKVQMLEAQVNENKKEFNTALEEVRKQVVALHRRNSGSVN